MKAACKLIDSETSRAFCSRRPAGRRRVASTLTRRRCESRALGAGSDGWAEACLALQIRAVDYKELVSNFNAKPQLSSVKELGSQRREMEQLCFNRAIFHRFKKARAVS